MARILFWPYMGAGQKIWGLGSILLVTVIVLALFPASSDIGLLASLVNFGIYITCGLNGNSWREKNLVSRGYECQKLVEAANTDKAMAIYLGDEA